MMDSGVLLQLRQAFFWLVCHHYSWDELTDNRVNGWS